MEYETVQDLPTGDALPGRKLLTAAFLVLFCLMVSFFWPEGRDFLRTLLIPGDPEVTLEAAEAFALELHQGFPPGEAAKHFCQTVLK